MATKSIGYVADLKGDAQVRSVDGIIRVLSIGDQVNEGDVLTTGLNTDIQLEFYDGQRLQIGESTEMLLDDSVYASLNPYPDARADQLAELQNLIVEGIDLAELEATAAGEQTDGANALHQASVYSRDGIEGIVETRITPFGNSATGFNEPFINDLDALLLADDEPEQSPAPTPPITTANTPPVALDNLLTTDEDLAVNNINVLGNDSDADADTLAVTAASSPNGTVSINPDGSLNYLANPDFSGTDVITYSISDGRGGTDTATVTVTVNPINDPATVSSASDALGETDALLSTSGTLTSTDVDNIDNAFTAITVNGTIGDFAIDATGNWTFTANSAYDNLNVGDSVNETFNVTSVDGTPSTVQITIDGTNDAAIVSSDSQTLTETDVPVSTTGTLTSTDVDNADNSFTAATINGTIGDFVIDATGNWTFTANSAFDNLNVGDSVNETFSVTSVDGTPSTVQITINGTNDAATVSSDAQVLTETDAPVSTSGTLTSVDVDNADNAFTAATVNGTIGDFAIDATGNWTFTANSAYDNLNVGDSVNETFNVTNADGTPSTVQITINGTNDAATVSSDAQTLTETDVPVSTTGTLTSTDVDNTDNSFTAATINGTIGDFVIDATGNWTFTANSAFDNLNVGDSVNETFNVTSVDGTPSTVQITINGTNDAATVSSDAQTLTETDVPVSTTGTLISNDVDNPGNAFTATTVNGTIGDFAIDATGNWTFTANSAFDNLNVGDNVNETFNVTSADGTPSTVQITINGTNDAATVSSDAQTLTETDVPVSTSGTLTSTDVDNTDNAFTAATVNGTIGDFAIDATGNWTFTANSAFDNLNVGDNVNETFNVTSADGTPSTVQITINGTNDAATVSSDAQTLTETDVPVSTTGTLTSTDVDNVDNSFTAATINGTIGDFAIDATGNWTFTANSAFDNLNVGDSFNETFSVTSVDGTPSTVQITINGTNDAATVSSDAQTLTETDVPVSTTGTLTSTDVDNAGNAFTATTVNGTIGDFAIDATGNWTFTANSAFDNLNVGDSVNETFNVTSVDGTPSTVQITISGTNDAATVSSDAQVLTETDVPVSTTGTLTSTDVDNTDNAFTATTVNGTIGDFAIDATGNWTFTANSAFDSLNVGDSVNETFSVTSVDGTPSAVQITINGTNDSATVSSDTQTLTETDVPVSTSGTLTSTDVDNIDNAFTATTVNGTIGDFAIDATGNWTFTANNSYDNLNVGDSVNETFNVTSADGTPSTVQITINGTNDAATVSSDAQTLTETDVPVSTTGTLTSTDVDNADNSFTAATINGTIGDFVIDATGNWTFTANNAYDSLNVGDSVNETFNVTSADGTPSTVQITINGSNDVATVSADSQSVVEDSAATLTTGGSVTITDVDSGEAFAQPQTNTSGTYGIFNVDTNGNWTYQADNSLLAIQQLGATDSLTETFTVTSQDGSASNSVTVTIQGTNDGPIATDSSITTSEDSQDVALNLPLPTDVDASDVLTVTVTGVPNAALGAVTLSNGTPVLVNQTLTLAEFQGLQFDTVLNATGTSNFTYQVSDGLLTDNATATITVGGSNDAPVAVSNSYASDEDTSLSGNVLTDDTGTGIDSDPDGDSLSVSAINGVTSAIGVPIVLASGATLTMQSDGNFSYDPGTSAVFNALGVADSTTDSFTYTVIDGNGASDIAIVTLTINGTNDAATVSSDTQTLTETDAPVSTSGTLTSTDVDNTDNAFTAITVNGTIGDFAIDATGNWTFTANSAFDSLNVGDSVNETFNVTSVDGTPSTVQITINGTNDAATVSSDAQTLTETDAPVSTSGTLTSTDADNADNAFTVNTINGTIGDFAIDATGNWTFTANSAFDNLNVGDSVNETFNVTSVDGTPSTVQITINGTNDAATVSSDTQTLTETDVPVSTSGTLTSTDADNADNAFTATTVNGTIGDFAIDATGNWTFTANSAFDNLNVGDSVNETFNVTSVDGTPSTVQITINGTNDAATVSSDAQTLTETDVPVSTSGTLTSTDVDNTDNAFTAGTVNGTIGDFAIDAIGNWTFTANSAYDNLNVGDSVNETFNVTSVDGTPSTVQITINGTNDAATVSSDAQTLTETDAPVSTSGTLTSTDADNADNAFTATTVNGTIGDFAIDATGNWTFTANSAFDNLNVGDSVNETFNVTSVDGTPSTVQITINGTNDAATVSSDAQILTETDTPVSTSGTLTSTDVDNTDNAFTATTVNGTIGDFAIDATGNWTFTANSAFDNLNVGDSVNETFNVTSVDGTPSTVQITINGTNDAATVSSDAQVLTETDVPVSTSGTLTSTDIDNADNSFTAATVNGTIGDFAIDATGNWTFTANSAFDSLNVGDSVNETFNVTSADGTPSTVQITINGTNDAATVSSDARVLTETDTPVSTSGTLTSTDADNPDNAFTAATVNGTIGDFTIDATGNWTFTANSAFDNLNVGDSVNETFNVTSVDGTPSTVQITINGTNDAATVSSDAQTLTETDAPVSTSGTLTSTDVDNTDNAFTAITVNGTIGDFAIDATGNWTFTANSAYDSLNVGDSVNETFNVTSVDGTPSTVQITINGTNDAATVSSDTQTLTETDVPVSTSGTLTSTDADNADNAFTVNTINGTIGDFAIDATGNWTFTANSAFDNLNVGDSVNETFNVTSVDGTPSIVQITINGTNDAATVSSDAQTLTETDAPVSTSGTLTSTDADNTDNAFTAITVNGTIGDFAIDATGNWTFTANSAFDSLNVGDSVNETFNVTSVDGTPSTVQITINGTNDAATVSSDAQTLTETDAPVSTSGTLTSTDADNADNAFTVNTINGTIGDFAIDATGNWTFTANSAFDNLNVGDSVNETFNVTSVDGTPSTVQITINGTNDAATVSSDAQVLTETDVPVITTGTLTSTDADNTDNAFTAITVNGTIGDFAIDATGNWTFTANSAFDSLNVGDSVNETFNVTSVDGTPSTVQITINGTNDAATVSSDAQTLTETDAPVSTSGTLTSTDADNADNAFTVNTINGTIGDFAIDATGNWTFTANSAFDSLNVGDSVNETFNVTSVDGTPSTVQITINGTNDAATVSSDAQVLTETDVPVITTGTLTSTDADNTDNAFTAITVNGTIGDFAIDATGNWTFTANSAFDSLNVGDSVNETFNVTSVDGTPSTVQITINGTNDAATVSSDAQTLTETDAPVSTSGTLTSTDADNADNAFTVNTINGTIGDFAIDATGNWTFTANSAFDNLNVGDSVNETFNVTSVDGTPSTVQITINGTNDAATVSSDTQTLTETDVPVSTSGTLTSTDVDNTDNAFTATTVNGTIGDFAIDATGNWTFTANSAFDSLNVGDSVNETFNVTSVDGTPSTVQITINGTNDAATVSSDTQVLTETDVPVSTSGTLTSTDVDNTDNAFTATTVNGTIGDFAIDATGNWTFTANNAYDSLNVGDSVNETFNITSVDGTPSTVQITINGTNDAATVSSDTQALTETDVPVSTSGTLTSTDVDNTDNAFTATTVNGTIGDFAIDATGNWTFTANSAFDSLNVGDSVNETFNVTSVDGTPSTVQITINGTNDAATVSSDTQVLTETDVPVSTSGTLTSTDVDNTDNAFTATTVNGTIGDFAIDATGNWTFTANNAYDSLNVGDSVNETFNITSVDGTPSTVQITINGTNDAATVSSDTQALTETDVPVSTTGTLTSTDADNTDNSFTAATINGTIGELAIDATGNWTFTANSAFDNLNVGDSVNETFNVTSVDGTPSTVQITINGTNDAATVSSDAQTLTETDLPVSTTGTLTSTDVDNADNSFTAATINGTIGDFVIDATGNWTFTANSAYDSLNVGDSVNETFNVTSVDGTPSTVQITINGTNDAATVSSDAQVLTETDAPVSTSGTLTSTDVDNADNAFTAITVNGTLGDFAIDATGNWTFTANSAFDNLNVGDSVNETFNVTSADGTPSTVQITINGTNDAATVSSDAQTLTETDVPVSTTGTLTSTDADNTDNAFTASTVNGTIGDFAIDATGNWTFTANSAFDNLNVGDSVNETFNVTSVDGTPSIVQITINGTNDAATVSGDAQTLTETDVPVSTTGTLTSTDVDNADNSFTAATINGTIGDFAIDATGNWTFTANSAYDSLNVGDSVNETFNITSVDGTPSTVQITINGTNDAATVSSDTQALTETDVPVSTTGTLTSTDVDNTDNAFTATTVNGTIGDFAIDATGNWTFTANSAFDNLNVGDSVNETFNVTSVDGTPSTVQITINGSNDAATVSSDAQTLTETDVPVSTSGTLTSTDADNADNAFTVNTINGTIGDFAIDATGNWTFTANSAFDNLNVGDSVNETFNVTSVDGTPSTVQITINGTNDAATVSSDTQTLTETDVPVSTSGTLTSTDVDNTDNAFTATTVNGTIGDFAIDATGNWTFTANSAFDNLNVGDSVNETFNVTSADGTPSTVQITINGTNDAATVSSDAQTLTETDAPVSTSGTLTSTDADNADNAFTVNTINGTIGDFAIDATGNWTFTANSAFDNLNVGDSVNETFNVTSADGTPSTVQITINGTNDAATVSSDAQTLTETDAPVSTSGTLTSTDADNADNAFTVNTINGTIGDFAIDATGNWTFTANSAFDNLNVGDSVNETFNVTSADGTPSTVQITINGTNDAATVSSDTQTLTETDVPVSTSGTLTSTDVDNTDNAFTATTVNGTIGDFAIDATGNWTFTANSAFDSLNVGDSVNETFNVTSVDGTPSTVQITINGTNDAATVSSDTQVLTETDVPVSTSGTLTSTDVDNTDNAFTATTVNGTIGDFAIDATGNWTFTANSAFDSLNVGDSVNETFNVTSVDGTPSTVQITINGTNDAATVSSDTQVLTETDTPVSTSGTLTSTDVDNTDNAFTATTVNGTIGDFTIDATGNWTFTANSAFDNLNVGDSVNETFNVTSVDGTPSTVQITINGTNDGPVIDLDANDSSASGNDYAVTFTEGGSAAYIADTDINITDIDSTSLAGATITVNSAEIGDLLTVGSIPAGITASSYDAVTGTISLSGSASWSDYQDAIRAIQFSNDGSTTNTTRDIDVVVNDGLGNSNTATTAVTIVTLPTVSVTDVSVQEPAAGTTALVFTVSIDQSLAGDLTFDYATADISALAGADFVGISSTVGTITAGNTSTTVTVTVNSDANLFEGDETLALNLVNFNQTVNFDAAAHTISGGVQGIGTIGANNGAPVAVDDNYITTVDTPLVVTNALTNDTLVDNARVDVSAYTDQGSGVYSFTGSNGTVVYDSNTGSFTFTPDTGYTGTAGFSYTLIDDDGETDTASVSVDVSAVVVNPPVVSNVADTAYTENDSPTAIFSGVNISDVDSSNLSSVVVTVDGFIGSQDVIDYLTLGTSVVASVTVTGSTWELTLTGGVDINEYETVLDSITYLNSSDNPSTSVRNITIEAFDESYANLFGSDVSTLSITAVNDAPDATDNDLYSFESSQNNALGITAPTDADNDDNALVITVTALPGALGIVTLSDGTPVTLGQTLSLAELTSLEFDAGTAQGNGTFSYTVDDGQLTTTGTTTINVGATNPDFATVYESGLAGGTGTGSPQVTGNLFANDGNAGTSIDSIDFGGLNFTPIGGVITVDTPLGSLTVYADNGTTGFAAGDYVYTLDTADNTGADVDEIFAYNFTNGIGYSDNLTISIIDDIPVANDVVQNVPESEEKVFNIIFTLDDSGSMGWGAVTGDTTPPPTEATRMDIAKESLAALGAEYFNQSTQVEITLVTFNSNASFVGTYSDFASFEAALNAVTPGGGTNYVDATDEIQAQLTADLAGQNPADDVQNVSYFISDGEANAGTSPIGSGYIEFANTNSIDSYSVGIGSSLPGDLSDLNYIHNIDSLGRGGGTVDDALIVTDVSELESELLSTVPTAFGGNITANGSVSNVLFGADGGYVQSFTTDIAGTNYTFSYDGSTVSVPAALAATVVITGSTIELGADDGFAYGTFTFNFSDGSYTLSAPNGLAPSVFDFDYVIIDGDNDTASATARINIIDDAPDARDDLHSLDAFEIAAGNVVTALGTDGGPQFGSNISPFSTQGGGVDKVVDNAVVTEFTYKGSTISIDSADLSIVVPPAPTGGSENIEVNSQASINASNFTISGFSGGTPDSLGFDTSGGTQGVGVGNNRLNNGESLVIDFDLAELPYGAENLTLTMNDFGGGDEVDITVYDIDGTTVLASFTHTAGDGTAIDLSTYSGIGSVQIEHNVGGDSILQFIEYDPVPAPAGIINPAGGDNGANLTWTYSYEIDIDGNDIYQATVTDANDGSEFIMRSNGFYQFTPDQSGGPVDASVDTTSQANVNASDLNISVRAGGGGLQYSGDGVGVAGGSGQLLSSGEALLVAFDAVALPDGVNNLVLTINDFQSANNDQATVIVTHDSDGDGNLSTDTIVLSATGSGTATLDLSQFSGVTQFDIEYTGTGWDLGLGNVSYQVPATASTSSLEPQLIDYTLTDTDGQSDTAQLALYTIDQTISGTSGIDNIAGAALNDAIIGGDGDDILSGGAGNDSISGGADNDILSGGAGNDYLSGGDGLDTLSGGIGDDTLDGGAGDDTVDGSSGDDVVLGGAGNDSVYGGAGDDRVEGGLGDDLLVGGAGSDILFGGEGEDRLIGGSGNDSLIGGDGIDIFALESGDEGSIGTPAVDTISDFTLGVGGDVLDLSDMLQNEDLATLDGFLNFNYDGVTGDTTISVDVDGDSGAFETSQQIVLSGVDLTANGTLSDQQILDSLLNNGNLIVDQ